MGKPRAFARFPPLLSSGNRDLGDIFPYSFNNGPSSHIRKHGADLSLEQKHRVEFQKVLWFHQSGSIFSGPLKLSLYACRTPVDIAGVAWLAFDRPGAGIGPGYKHLQSRDGHRGGWREME